MAPKSTQDAPRVLWKVVIGADRVCLRDLLAAVNVLCKRYVFQKEKGEQGNEHWQCLLAFHTKKRHTAVLSALAGELACPTVNIQVDKKKADDDFAAYCSKEDTRLEGPWSRGYPHIQEEPITVLHADMFYPWQTEVLKMVQGPASERQVHWYWEARGNTGKTALIKHLMVKEAAMLICGGMSDMASRVIMNGSPKIAIVQLTRAQGARVDFQVLENFKDGIVVSGKYEGGQKVFNPPHVLVFANAPPDLMKLSVDRWVVHEVPARPEPLVAEVEGFWDPLVEAALTE